MACGGCKARGEAIVKGVRSIAKGDLKDAADQSKFVVKTMAQDTGSALRQQVAVARQRLTRR